MNGDPGRLATRTARQFALLLAVLGSVILLAWWSTDRYQSYGWLAPFSHALIFLLMIACYGLFGALAHRIEAPGVAAVWRRHRLKLALSLAIGLALAWLLQRGALPLLPSPEAFARADWGLVALYAVAWLALHFIRAARWYWPLAALGHVPMGTVLRASFAGFAAIVLLPLRAGEAARPLLIAREGHVSGWAAAGTIGAERVIDGLCLSLMLLAALLSSTPLDPLPERIGALPVSAALVPQAAYAALAVFALAFVVMGLFYACAARRLPARLALIADGLRFLGRRQYAVPFLAGTALYWAGNAALYWLLGLACGLPLSLPQAVVVMGVLGLGILLPNAPGYFGAFQLSIYAALALYFSPEDVVGAGAAYVFLAYTIQIGITLAAGAASAWRGAGRVPVAAPA